MPLITGPELASHDHLGAVSSRADDSELEDSAHAHALRESSSREIQGGSRDVAAGPSEGPNDHHNIAGGVFDDDSDAAMKVMAVSVHSQVYDEPEGTGTDAHDGLSMGNTDVEMLSDIDLQDALGLDV